MASIVKRNSTYSVVYYFKDSHGVKKQKWETYKTLEDAQKRKEIIESGFAFNMKPIRLFKDLVNEFLECYGKVKWSYSTFSYNTSLLNRYILNRLGELPLSSFSTRMLNNYYSTLERQLPVKTVLTIHKILKTIFRQAVIWECIEYNPADRVVLPAASNNSRDILDMEQINILLNHCRNDPVLSLCVQLSFACSLRKGEILALTWDDIDFESGIVHINKELTRINKSLIQTLNRKDIIYVFPDQMAIPLKTCTVLKTPKTESSNRDVYIPKTLLEQLALYQKIHSNKVNKDKQIKYQLIFCNSYGFPLTDKILNDRLRKHLSQCNLPDVVFHSFRHSSVTYKLKITNGDIKSVQGDTGHSQVNMITDIYSHILDSHRKETAEKFEELYYQSVRPPFISN